MDRLLPQAVLWIGLSLSSAAEATQLRLHLAAGGLVELPVADLQSLRFEGVQPPAPRVDIRLTGGQLALSWAPLPRAAALWSTATPYDTGPAAWVLEAAFVAGSQGTQLPIDAGRRFYQLRLEDASRTTSPSANDGIYTDTP